jgi:meiotic recombination protein DMC1
VSAVKLQQKLAQMLSRLTKIADEFNVAVYIMNQGWLC